MYRSKKKSPPQRFRKSAGAKAGARKAEDPPLPAVPSKEEENVADGIAAESHFPSITDAAGLARDEVVASGAHASSVVSSTSNPPHDSSDLRQIVEFKEKFTAPVAIYDGASKRICVNPSFDRLAVSQLSRIQGVVLHQLRQSQRDAAARTPKELLFDMERALLCVVASASVAPSAGDSELFLPISDDVDAAKAVPQIESIFARHAAAAKAVAAVGYVLSEGISHDTLDGFLRQLTDRLAAESDPAVNTRRTPEERQALRGTANNVRDFAQLFSAVKVAYGGIYTNSQRQRTQPFPLADGARVHADANGQSARLLLEGYYKLLRWVLAVNEDRLALLGGSQELAGGGGGGGGGGAAAAGLEGPVGASAGKGGVWVAEYDPHAGRIALERRSPSHRWGLIFDASGFLVGIENALRNGSEAGERLYYALQQSKGAAGMAVLQANRRRIRATNLTAAELETKRQEILTRLTDCFRSDGKTLQLVVEKRPHAELTAAREVFFETSQQGGERGVGQQVVLILERATPTIPWGLRLAALPNRPPQLTNFSDKLQLSKRAKDFLFDHRGRLQVVSVNYRDTQRHFTTEQLKQYMSESLLLALWLQVTDSPSDGIAGASFLGDEQHAKEPTKDVEDPLGGEEAYRGVLPEAAEKGDEAQAGLDETEESAAATMDHEDRLSEGKKSAKAVKAIRAEDGAWAGSENLLAEQEEDTVEDTLDNPLERDAELEGYESFEKEPDLSSTNEDLGGVREIPEEGSPRESGSDGLEGAEAEETGPEEVDRAALSDTKKDKVASKKDKRSKKTSKKGKPPQKGRKKSSEKEETMTPEEEEEENATINEDEVSHEGIEENTEPSGTGDSAIPDATGETPLIDSQPTSAEIAMQIGKKSSKNANDPPKGRKSKLSKDPLSGAPGEDVPLVDSLKTPAEVAMEVAGGGDGAISAANASSSVSEAPAAGSPPVSITQLLSTAPLEFENKVIANKFDGTALELSRPSVEVPWNIKMAFVGDEVLLSKLPVVANDKKDHPYLKYLGAAPDGNIRCAVESMNGVDLLVASKLEKARLMETVKKSMNLSMILKVIR